jgi:hypothetical protein
MLLPLLLLLPLFQESAAEPAAEVLLSMQCSGPRALLVDEKDQGLLRALEMVEARLLEIGPEFGEEMPPTGAIEFLVDLLTSPHSLTVGIYPEPIAGMPLPLVGEFLIGRGSATGASEFVDEAVALLDEVGMPLETPAAGEPYILPLPVPVWMGTEGESLVVEFGKRSAIVAPSIDGLLPAGATNALSGRIDYGKFIELVMGAMGGAEAPEVLEFFDQIGLSAITYEWAVGSDEERGYWVFNMPDWADEAREMGVFPSTMLGPDALAVIPVDATWASVFSVDFRGLFNYYQKILASVPGEEIDLAAMIEEMTGLDVDEALLAPLGTRGCIYAADSTGGGGALSMVAVLELADREAFLKTLAQGKEAATGLGAQFAEGYIRFSDWSANGLDGTTLTFPGLPVPLELSVVTTEHHAIFGLTPQAALAATAQILEPGPSLLDNPAFQEQLPSSLDGLVAIQWVDTPRLLRDSYGTMSLLCSSLSNAVRSKSDPTRDPGMILPSYRDFAAGAKGIVGVVQLVGNDFRSEYRGDRSQLVNAAGIVGMLYNGPLLPLAGLGLTGTLVAPRAVYMMDEPEEDPSMEIEMEIDMIRQALEEYALENGGRYPDSLGELFITDENGQAYLYDTDVLSDPWGDAYGYRKPTEENPEPDVFWQ